MGWTKAETDHEQYGEAVDWLATPEIEAIFGGTRDVVTQYGARKVHDLTVDGEKKSAWGKARLDSLLASVPEGSRIRVQFRGKVRLKNGHSLNDFEVDVWQGEEGQNEDPGF